MDKVVSVASPAKVNLHLDIREKRADGFHTLRSIFQLVSFGDDLTVRSLKVVDVCTIRGDFDFEPSRNTIMKAAEAFRRETGIRSGLAFSVVKRIPCGSGTGGGSSNAAAALVAMNALFGMPLSPSRLAVLGAGIGSDVPFFCTAATAWVTGRGEVIEPLPTRSDLFVLLVYPAQEVSTVEAFRLLDRWRERGGPEAECSRPVDLPVSELIRAYHEDDPRSWPFFNSFFSVIRERYPELDALYRRMCRLGALFAGMSGSGSAVFGLFPSFPEAEIAADRLRSDYPILSVCKMLDRLPNAVLQW